MCDEPFKIAQVQDLLLDLFRFMYNYDRRATFQRFRSKSEDTGNLMPAERTILVGGWAVG